MMPASRAALKTQWCTSVETYIAPGRRSAPRRSRAQRIALKVAIEPPAVRSPAAVSGNCIHTRNQSRTLASSCTSAGAARQMPVKRFAVDAIRSARPAGKSPPPGMKAM